MPQTFRRFVSTLAAVATVVTPFTLTAATAGASTGSGYGSLAVEVHTVGGTSVFEDYTYRVSGSRMGARGFLDGSGVASFDGVPSGVYAVSVYGPEGYSLAYAGDCDAEGSVQVGAGASAVCRVTATADGWERGVGGQADTGTLSVVKSFVFAEDVAPFGTFSFTVGSQSWAYGDAGITQVTLEAATYVVSEVPVSGYTVAYQGDCSRDGTVTVVAGRNAECRISATRGVGGFNPGSDVRAPVASPAPVRVAQGGASGAAAGGVQGSEALVSASPSVTASASPLAAAVGGVDAPCIVKGGWLTTLVIVAFALMGLLLILVSSLRGGRAFLLLLALALVLYWLGSGCADALGWLPFVLAAVVYVLLGRTPDAA